MQTAVLTAFLMFWSSLSPAAPVAPDNFTGLEPADIVHATQLPQEVNRPQNLYLAEADREKKDNNKPESGDLVIPGQEKAESEKKCLNICRKWGEDCIINPRTGARNCRRTCKDFGMECF